MTKSKTAAGKDDLQELELQRSQVSDILRELSDLKFALDESTIVAITDHRGTITYVNEKFCRISKFEREELIGQNHRIINSGYHPPEFFQTMWKTIANGGVWRGEIRNRAKDGSTYWVATTIVPFLNSDGKPNQYVAIRHDITDQKHAEQRVAEKEIYLRSILESVPGSILLLDPLRKILEINRAGLEMIEADSISALSELRFDQFVAAEYLKDFQRMIERTIAGESADLEYEIEGLGGKRLWLLTETRPFVDTNGSVFAALAVSSDITGRKTSEFQLLEQNRLLEQTHDAIFTWRFDDGITYWNKSAEHLYGYSLAEVEGKEAHEVLSTVYPDSYETYLEELKRDQKWAGELQQKTRSGRSIFVESRHVVATTKDGELIVLETSKDITERKAADERIVQQAALLDQSRDAIIVCDLGHRIIYWNKGAERVYGWTAAEVLGRDLSDAVCGGEALALEKALSAFNAADEFFEEIEHLTKADEKITVVSNWLLVRNELGQPDYLLLVNRDVTEIKQIEEQLFRAQRMESIGTLAGGIAHDLNNVLSPILMSVEMLQSDGLAEGSGEPWLSIIRENTTRGADLIKQVLTFARGVEGDRLNVQIRHIVKDLISVLKETFPKSITVKYDIEPDLDLVSADPTQIHQVLMNLAVNARDAMKNGGKLTINARNVSVTEDEARKNIDARPGRYVFIVVKDTGEGITPDVLKRIWDPFYTTKEIGKGTGLGLSTALSIVKSHKGFIDVDSEPGKGSGFSIYLPAADQGSESSEHSDEKALPKGSGQTILLVDDEEIILQVTSAALEKYGYKTLSAADGTEAVALFAQNKNIELVITDMSMPFMDGAATIRALRKIDPEVKIIAASGLPEQQDSGKSESQANAFLSKPITTEALLNSVAAVLSDPS